MATTAKKSVKCYGCCSAQWPGGTHVCYAASKHGAAQAGLRLPIVQLSNMQCSMLSCSCLMQLANMERLMTINSFPDCSIPAARCFYRAAAELIQQTLNANESPNGEAERGSQRYRNLMAAMTSFIRAMTSWAQLEFANRLACSVHTCQLSIRLLFGLVSSARNAQHKVHWCQELLPESGCKPFVCLQQHGHVEQPRIMHKDMCQTGRWLLVNRLHAARAEAFCSRLLGDAALVFVQARDLRKAAVQTGYGFCAP